jgi:hypothetical protein
MEAVKDRKCWIRRNPTIKHLDLPIDTWNVESATYSKYK